MNAECLEIQSVLPWLVNGSLEGSEKLKVFSHMAVCPGCRKEMAFLTALQKMAVSSEKVGPDKETVKSIFENISAKINESETGAKTDAGTSAPAIPAKAVKNPAQAIIMDFVLKSIGGLDYPWISEIREAFNPVIQSMALYARFMRKVLEAAA